METLRVVAYVALAGLAPVILLTVVMLRGVVGRRAGRVVVGEPRPAAEPQRAGTAL